MTDKEAISILRSHLERSGKLIESTIKKSEPELIEYLDKRFNDANSSTKLIEYLYRLENGIENLPVCHVCGNEVKFTRYCKGYSQFCSDKCRRSKEGLAIVGKQISSSISTQTKEEKEAINEKRKATNLEKYGFASTGQVEIFREKAKKTNLERYGVECTFNSDVVKDKRRETILSRYGVAHHMQSPDVKEKTKKTNLERYGSEAYWNSDDFYAKSAETKKAKKIARWKEMSGYDVDYLPNGNLIVKNACKVHGDVEVPIGMMFNRVAQHSVICPICNPIDKGPQSSMEIEIKELLDHYKIAYKMHDRSILQGNRELDIVIPSINLAIECNGVYWHSDQVKHRMYHQEKAIECEQKGWQLIQIWEDDYALRKEIIFDLIKAKIGIVTERVFARKCEVCEVSNDDARAFLTANHLQGPVNSSFRYGLIYEGMLVALMTFGKLRRSLGSKSEEGSYELYRYCTLRGYEIVGGAGKLLEHFKRHNDWKQILTYAKYDISQGNLYEKIGFKFTGLTDPNYFWVNKKTMIRENRFKYRKSAICSEEDKSKSEQEIMYEKGYFKCYDSGNKRYIMKNEAQGHLG